MVSLITHISGNGFMFNDKIMSYIHHLSKVVAAFFVKIMVFGLFRIQLLYLERQIKLKLITKYYFRHFLLQLDYSLSLQEILEPTF